MVASAECARNIQKNRMLSPTPRMRLEEEQGAGCVHTNVLFSHAHASVWCYVVGLYTTRTQFALRAVGETMEQWRRQALGEAQPERENYY